MATSAARRYKREQEREKQKLIQKLHSEFLQRIKGKSDEEVMHIINQMGMQYGVMETNNAIKTSVSEIQTYED